MKNLNFNKMQKPVMRIELADEKKTILFVLPPSKAEAVAVSEMTVTNSVNNLEKSIEMCARLMSRNVAKIPVTADDIADWDIYDVKMFFATYMEFLFEIKNAKN